MTETYSVSNFEFESWSLFVLWGLTFSVSTLAT